MCAVCQRTLVELHPDYSAGVCFACEYVVKSIRRVFERCHKAGLTITESDDVLRVGHYRFDEAMLGLVPMIPGPEEIDREDILRNLGDAMRRIGL